LEKPTAHRPKVVVYSPHKMMPPVIEPFFKMLDPTLAEGSHVNSFAQLEGQFTASTGVLVLAIMQKEELFEALKYLGTIQDKISESSVRVLVLNQIQNDKVNELFRAKGVLDVLDFNISLKAFHYKVKNFLQLLENSKTQSGKDSLAANRAAKNAKGSGRGALHEVEWTGAMEHFGDFWMLMSPKHVRYVIGKWFVNFYGPGPSTGTWEKTDLVMYGQNGWKWNPRSADDYTFYKDGGRWIFFGNCPEFSWEQKHWYFIGAKPTFAFFQGAEMVYEKFKFLESGNLSFRKTSQTGLEYMLAIEESIEASILLKNSKISDKNANVENDGHLKNKKRFPEDPTQGAEDVKKSFQNPKVSLALKMKNGVELPQEVELELIELRESRAVLEVPADLLKVNDEIKIAAKVTSGESTRQINFEARTQVLQTNYDGIIVGEGKAVAVCELNALTRDQFMMITEVYSERRREQVSFFRSARGGSFGHLKAAGEAELAFITFLQAADILIVDHHFGSRVSLEDSLIELGATEGMIRTASSFEEAKIFLEVRKPSMIFADYELQDALGTSLKSLMNDTLFFLVSGNSSRAAVARAAEDEIDNFIFKPYQQEELRDILSGTIANWLSPSEGQRLIAEGRKLLANDDYRGAVESFEKAKRVPEFFACASAHLGSAHQKNRKLNDARMAYENALQRNPAHFKSMNGLFEFLLSSNQLDEAYTVLKDIIANFPEGSKRLSQGIAMGIKTKNFKDMEVFHAVYEGMTDKTPDLKNHLSSALSVSGRYFLSRKDRERAFTHFESALNVTKLEGKFVAYILDHLNANGMLEQGESLVRKIEMEQAASLNAA
jgi:tetratricopeptide (TPR) repeat protein